VVSSSFGSRYATRLLCFPCRVTRNSKTSGATPGQVFRHQPDAVPSPRVLPAGPCLHSSNRRIALVPPLSLFGVSAVLGATVSGSLHRWPRLPVALQLPTQFIARAINLRGWVCMNDHEWRERVGIARFGRLTPVYLTTSCCQNEMKPLIYAN